MDHIFPSFLLTKPNPLDQAVARPGQQTQSVRQEGEESGERKEGFTFFQELSSPVYIEVGSSSPSYVGSS